MIVMHDAMRVDRKGRPTFDSVMRGVGLLRKHGVQFNTLTVVNRINAMRPVDVYRFLRNEIGSTRIQSQTRKSAAMSSSLRASSLPERHARMNVS